MEKSEVVGLLDLHYPDLCAGEFAQEIADNSFPVRFKQGDVMVKYNDEVDYVPLILEGEAEIKTTTSSAKEIIAYTVKPGGYCSLVLLNCLTGTPSLVKAECTKDISAVMVPKSVALNWLSTNPNWHKHLMEDVSIKYSTLLSQLK
jgi:CRP-like cAMP-binding protein